MSYQIYYDKAFIKVEDKFVPMINSGSNNCWEVNFFGKEIPVKPITSFDTIAYNTKENKILCVIDALHDNFYTQKYVDGKRKGEPEFLPLNKVLELQNEYKIYSFEPLTKLNSTVVSLFDGFRLASEDEGNLITAKELYPLYVRKSQAEEQGCK